MHSKLQIKDQKKFNLVLSPEFYWVRIFDIPVSSEKEALKLLPTLFEESISVDDLNYYVIKLEDQKFLSFAYDQKKILQVLKSLDISLSNVANFYFAQNEVAKLCDNSEEKYYEIDGVKFQKIDNMLVQIPSQITIEYFTKLDIQNLKLSKHKVFINSGSQYINTKLSYSLSIVLLILSSLILLKSYIMNIQIDEFEQKNELLIEKYSLPPTSMQLRSIIESQKIKLNSQKNLRSILRYIFDYKKTKDFQIESLSIKNKQVKIVFSSKSKRFISYIQKKYKIKSNRLNGRVQILEVTYE